MTIKCVVCDSSLEVNNSDHMPNRCPVCFSRQSLAVQPAEKTIARQLVDRDLLEAEAKVIDVTGDTMTLQYVDGSVIRLKITAPTRDGQSVEVREMPLS